MDKAHMDHKHIDILKKKYCVDKSLNTIYNTNSIPAEPLPCMLNCGGFFFLRDIHKKAKMIESVFEYIGNHFSRLGKKVPLVLERHFEDMRDMVSMILVTIFPMWEKW
jgi:hypothetical protein